ncbi:MAG: branched-chain amino acid ABC transporter ATP-binding protein/permease [Phycisphaerae bacterium]
MSPRMRSILHALSFFGVLLVIYLVSLKLDIPANEPGAVLGAYGHQLLLDIGIAIILAVSLNLILGIAGQFSLGHAGFAAAGAYTAAIVSGYCFPPVLRYFTAAPYHFSTATTFHLLMILGIVAGALVAAVLGLVVGLPTLRLRGDYLAIATLGFGEILAVFFQNFSWNGNMVFGGSTGLSLSSMRNEWISNQPDPDVPLVQSVQDYLDRPDYAVGCFAVFAVALLTIYIVHNIKYATSGRALLAIREDTIASESVGVSSTRYKVAAFVIGAALAGLAGGLIAHHKSLVNPESFRFMRSIELVAMVILGGQGSITGSVLAAIALTLLPEVLRSYVPESIMSANTIEKWRMVIYSLCIILAMLFRPQGIFGRYEISDLFRWVFRVGKKRAPRSASAGEPAARWAGATRGEEAAGEPLLQVSHVTMQFGGLKAVDDFSLTLMPGELVGLIGPNGAGKTTAFNVMTGVYRPTKGQITIAGRPTRRLKPHSISKLGVARTFQNIRLFANLSVLDNVQIAQHAHHRQGIPSAIVRRPAFYREEAESRENALGFLRLFDLEHLAEERANSLSYGDQRRLEIARALATRPKILCLDEPAAGMNPTEKRELMAMIRRIREEFSLTILLIEHDMKVIMGTCERILVLDYGKTIAAGTPEEIRNNPAVIEAYLGASVKQG